MVLSSEQFITQMKFQELRIQRESTLTAYRRVKEELAQAEDDAARVRVLYEELRRLRFAKQSLHPGVANLEPILYDTSQQRSSSETLAFWRHELEQELARGELRSEVVYIFGALLEEWSAGHTKEAGLDPTQQAFQAELLELATTVQASGDYLPLLEPLLADSGLSRDKMFEYMQLAISENVYVPHIDKSELELILEQIKVNPYRSPAVRNEASRFLVNPTLLKELSDALTILLDHIDEWNWPETGVPARALWARTKWRLFLDEDLPTACLLELLGRRWQEVFTAILGGQRSDRIQRLQRLLEIGAPAILVENARTKVAASEMSKLLTDTDIDIWTEDADEGMSGTSSENQTAAHSWEPGSIYARRLVLQGQLRDWARFAGYGGYDQTQDGMETALMLINAEIELGRAAFPGRPLYVVKVDLKNFYPSIPHDVLLTIVSSLGVTGKDLEFFRRYLRTRMAADGDVFVARSGMPNQRHLSDLLAELLLLLLDRYVQRAARVETVRLIDDICLLATSPEEAIKAWQAVHEFCSLCGLSVNEEKGGAVCIGGELPDTLPQTLPGWLLLRLDRDGQWSVDEMAFESFMARAREEMMNATSIIARVDRYNMNLAYLEQALALKAPLGDGHRRSVANAIWRFHHTFFPGDMSIVDGIRETIRERYMEMATQTHLPEGWFYWPITAGGLGLRQAVMRVANYADMYRGRKQVSPPTERRQDWQRRDNDWARFYGNLLSEVEAMKPTPNQVMETLVNDFIRRGADLSSGKQQTLSTYWRWVLYIYGPQILDAFGTFRFLFSELVPLQLLTERHLGERDA